MSETVSETEEKSLEKGKPHRWAKGVSGNPSGRRKKQYLSPITRQREGKYTWDKLLAIRDNHILERKFDKDGNAEDVYPSTSELIKVCTLILAYCWGVPTQKIALDDETKQLFAMNVVLTTAKEITKDGEPETGPSSFTLDYSDSQG